MSDAVVQCRELGRRFARREVLRGINLSVAKGELLAVVGPDGAGKTTLMQMLAGILRPTVGECRVLDFDVLREADAVTARIGYMSQGFTLYDRLSVLENLQFAARIRNVPDDIWQARARQLLHMAGLERFTERRAGALSGGMRKKLSLCTNLIHEPPLLLLDEPGLGVDPLSRRELWRILETYRAQGVAIIVATSYMDEAERGDRVLLLASGEAVALSTPLELRARCAGRIFELPAASVLPDGIELRSVQRLPRTWRLLFAEKPSTTISTSLIPVQPSLEDVFVDLTPAQSSRASVKTSSIASTAVTSGIAVSDLSIRFGSFTAVDRVSVTVAPGEIAAFLGPNGAGKTTLIRALCGLIKPSSGNATVADCDTVKQKKSLRSRIGYMSQHFSLYADLTARENLNFFASAYALDRATAGNAIAWARDVIDLPSDDSLVRDLSGATRQRLALACSLLHKPRVLFLDEPTSGVDPQSRYRFWSVIRDLAEQGLAIVVTTHYLSEAEYCNRINLMHNGQLIAAGTAAELRERFSLPTDASMEEVFIAGIQQREAWRLSA